MPSDSENSVDYPYASDADDAPQTSNVNPREVVRTGDIDDDDDDDDAVVSETDEVHVKKKSRPTVTKHVLKHASYDDYDQGMSDVEAQMASTSSKKKKSKPNTDTTTTTTTTTTTSEKKKKKKKDTPKRKKKVKVAEEEEAAAYKEDDEYNFTSSEERAMDRAMHIVKGGTAESYDDFNVHSSAEEEEEEEKAVRTKRGRDTSSKSKRKKVKREEQEDDSEVPSPEVEEALNRMVTSKLFSNLKEEDEAAHDALVSALSAPSGKSKKRKRSSQSDESATQDDDRDNWEVASKQASSKKKIKATTTSKPKKGAKVEGKSKRKSSKKSKDDGLSSMFKEEKAGTNNSMYVEFANIAKKSIKYDRKCWGCKYRFGQTRFPGKFPAMDQLWDDFQVNKGEIDPFHSARLLRQNWVKLIYGPAIDEGRKMMDWPVQVMMEHILEHLDDHKLMLQNSVRYLKAMLNQLRNNTFRRNKDGSISHDDKTVKLILATQKMINETINTLKTL